MLEMEQEKAGNGTGFNRNTFDVNSSWLNVVLQRENGAFMLIIDVSQYLSTLNFGKIFDNVRYIHPTVGLNSWLNG